MKVAIITPVYNPEPSHEFSHLYMILAQLCKRDPQYKNYWTNIKNIHKDAYVLLDNGCNENEPVTDLEILGLAADMGVQEIVAPDEYLKGPETVAKTMKFLDNYYNKYIKNNFKVMAVLQGTNRGNFLLSYRAFINDPRIDILGVGYRNLYEPFVSDMKSMNYKAWETFGIKDAVNLICQLDEKTFHYTMSRLYFLKKYNVLQDVVTLGKQIHLLGLYNPYELSLYKQVFTEEELKSIRGCDSAAPIQAAQAGVVFNKDYGVKTKPKAILDGEKRLTESEKELVKQNIEIMKEWVKMKNS